MSEFDQLSLSLQRNRVTRRQVLWLFGAGAVSALSGCAPSPVGGGSILVGMSEEEERKLGELYRLRAENARLLAVINQPAPAAEDNE